jgi:hypothetical protein
MVTGAHYFAPRGLNPTLQKWNAAELAERYKRDGMLAYVELIQRREKELGVDVLTHQKWYVEYKFIRSPADCLSVK